MVRRNDLPVRSHDPGGIRDAVTLCVFSFAGFPEMGILPRCDAGVIAEGRFVSKAAVVQPYSLMRRAGL
jgi:hypothetical protein